MLTATTFKAAKCPECGGDLQVPSDRDAIKCMYCGKDIIVRQAVHAAAGPNVQNLMKLGAAAEEGGNQDEAYGYFTRVLEIEPENCEAWFGKAVAAGWTSNLTRNRYSELLAGIERAIEFAPAAKRDEMVKRGADAVSHITVAYFKVSDAHTREYIALDKTWAEHIDRCLPMLSVLRVANTFDPTNKHVIGNGIYLAKSLIEGIRYQDPYDTDDDGVPRVKAMYLTSLIGGEQLADQVRQTMAEFVAKMKAMDATYEAPTITMVSSVDWGPFVAIAVAVGLLVVMVILFNAVVCR